MLVSIDAAAARLFRIIHVEDLEAREADGAAEPAEGVAITGVGADVVTGCEQMAGVEADTDPRGSADQVENLRQLLESVTEVGSLPGSVLEQDSRSDVRA